MPVLFYASAIQGALLFGDAAWQIELDEENAGWLLVAPGMPALVAVSNDLRQQSAQQFVGFRFTGHRKYANNRIREWQSYEEALRGVIPDDAMTVRGGIGIMPYYVPDLDIIDTHGLTDATVARNPVTRPNHERQLAHDRRPPPGYLQQRGVNFLLHAAATSEAETLTAASYALQVGPKLWMPFDAADHQWANERFADRNLRARNRFSLTDPAGNRLRVGRPPLRWGAVPGTLRGRPGRLAGRRSGHHQTWPARVLPGSVTDFWPRRPRLFDQLSPRRGG